MRNLLLATAALVLAAGAASAQEIRLGDPPLNDSGKLLATGGVSNLEGAGGGGISTWALITGYGTKDSFGADAHSTYVALSNYQVSTEGLAVGFNNRVEVSYAHVTFDTGSTGHKLGLGQGFAFDQNDVGVKVRLYGDAVYDQDNWMPQISAGVVYKSTDHANILRALGAKQADGYDVYLAASKLLLDQSLLVNGAVRLTKANQLGLLGFGGNRSDNYAPQFEGSVAYLLSKRFAVGVEYRTKADNLKFTQEDNWFTAYAAYFINKNASITLAYADLGTIATIKNQQGVYLSAQIGF